MVRGRPRPERRPGRQSRTPVPAWIFDDLPWNDDEDGPDGSAGVREPRRPKPFGPMAGAGELPEPEPFLYADLRR